MLVRVKHFVKVTGFTYLISLSGDIALAIHYQDVKKTLYMYLNRIQATLSSYPK
ncbi:hypothetical protein [Bacillus cereus]|uniref:hypothetical protein n=1 Tax=Bacillus cereus TaxID=1396 RepID=UPI002111393D|nr:hypothetical protein [Bacillus cereus]